MSASYYEDLTMMDHSDAAIATENQGATPKAKELREWQLGWRPAQEWKMVDMAALLLGCSVLGRGAEPPQFWVLLIWLEPGISHVTWVHYDATMCLACFFCSILPVLHLLRFDLCVL